MLSTFNKAGSPKVGSTLANKIISSVRPINGTNLGSYISLAKAEMTQLINKADKTLELKKIAVLDVIQQLNSCDIKDKQKFNKLKTLLRKSLNKYKKEYPVHVEREWIKEVSQKWEIYL
jgi:hypothetical protein